MAYFVLERESLSFDIFSGLTPALWGMTPRARLKSMKFARQSWEFLHVFVGRDSAERTIAESAKVRLPSLFLKVWQFILYFFCRNREVVDVTAS